MLSINIKKEAIGLYKEIKKNIEDEHPEYAEKQSIEYIETYLRILLEDKRKMIELLEDIFQLRRGINQETLKEFKKRYKEI